MPEHGMPEHGVRPVEQEIFLRFHEDREMYEGRVAIELRVEVETPVLEIDSEGLTIDELLLFERRGARTIERPLRWTGEPRSKAPPWARNRLRIVPTTPLGPGNHRLEVAFRGELRQAGDGGLFRVREGDDAYVFPFFQPDLAHTAFPCFDRPDFRIRFEIRLEIPAHHRAFANTRAVSEELSETPSSDGARRTVSFAPTPPIPTYLLAIAAGPLEVLEIGDGDQNAGRLVLPRGRDPRSTRTLRELISTLLPPIEAYFGSPHPFGTLDWLIVPGMLALGMEFPGLVALAEEAALLDDGSGDGVPGTAVDTMANTGPAHRRLARLVAHELAHQWFGNWVSPADWSELWLNESFARWMEQKAVEAALPELGIGLHFVREHQQRQVDDALSGSLAVTGQRGDPRSQLGTFGPAMVKGTAVLEMLEAWIGEAELRAAIRAHLQRFAWGSASTDDLLRSLDEAAGPDRKAGPSPSALARPFLDQPGLPEVSLELDTEAGVLRLRQERYRVIGRDSAPQLWQIPLVLAFAEPGSKVRQTRRLLLDGSSKSVPLGELGLVPGADPPWILPDAGAVGYYRFTLTEALLRPLVGAAAEGRLSPREVITLLGNLRTMLDAGDLDGGAYLRSLARLFGHPDPRIVDAALTAFEAVEKPFSTAAREAPSGLGGADPGGARFGAWTRASLGPALEAIGLDPRPGEEGQKESRAVRTLRPRLWLWLGLHGRDTRVLDRADALVRRWLAAGPEATLDPELAPAALRLAALRGDAELFERLENRLEELGASPLGHSLASALGGFEEPELRRRALDLALEGSLGPRAGVAIALGQTFDARGQERVETWAVENYDVLFEGLPPPVRQMIPALLEGCSESRLPALRRFFGKKEADAPGTALQLALATEQMEDCARLAHREGEAIRAYLAGF